MGSIIMVASQSQSAPLADFLQLWSSIDQANVFKFNAFHCEQYSPQLVCNSICTGRLHECLGDPHQHSCQLNGPFTRQITDVLAK